MKKKRPVLQDVADRVGMTEMTVSHFLRNSEQVSIAPCGEIAAAPDELGYIPDRVPDILSNATSRAIGVLLPLLINRVFTEVLHGIESATDTHGYQIMLAHYSCKPEMKQERLESMLSWDIDGLILTERAHMPRTLKVIEVVGIPVTRLVDSKLPCLNIAVGFDNFEAARQMTIAIIVRGRRHTAYLGIRLDERIITRQKGYGQTMLDTGLVPYNVMVKQSSSYFSGIELTHQVRREHLQLDDVLCTNDDLAVDIASECQRLGLKVLNDMVITSFHGHDIGQVMEPRLAGALTPRERVDSIGAERLLARIRGKSVIPEILSLGFTLLPGGFI